MAEAVEQGGGQLFVAEDLDRFREREVGGDDRGAPLVAVGEQVEEQFAAGPVEGHEAEFVDDQQRDTQVALLQAGECVFNSRIDQLSDETGGADEGDPLAALDGLDPRARDGACRCRSVRRSRCLPRARPTGRWQAAQVAAARSHAARPNRVGPGP